MSSYQPIPSVDVQGPEVGSTAWLKAQTIEVKGDKYDDFKENSKVDWCSLPQSVIGTLLYFMLVEQNNSPQLDIPVLLKTMALIGFPTYMVYCFQLLMLYGLWQGVYGSQDGQDDNQNAITDGICGIDPNMLVSAIGVYWISMFPSFSDMITTTDIIFNSKRVAYTQDVGDGDNAKAYITNITASFSKRVAIFVAVNAIELVVIIFLSYVGVGYLLSSDDVEDLLMNSVSIVFILQIDDMARDAFQRAQISDHIDGMEFETTVKSINESEKDMSLQGQLRPPTSATFKTFSSSKFAIIVLVLSVLCVYPLVHVYCS